MKIYKLSYFFIAILIFADTALFCGINLEERAQSFVLEAKQIIIPGHPHAFNPSVIRWKGKLLLAFREIPLPFLTFNSWIGLIWLDDNFCPISEPQYLNTNIATSGSEDARLIEVDGRLYMIYSGANDLFIQEGNSYGSFRVYAAELEQIESNFAIKHIECLSRFEGEKKERREKNWVPFNYQSHLLLAYSLLPHRILRPLLDSRGICETFSSSCGQIDWKWGELRGGTPGLLVDEQYLAFFHSWIDLATIHSNGVKMPHYFFGAYTFSSYPPFEITSISLEPIIGKHFYHGKSYSPYWHPVQVVFPCGFIFDEKFIWVTYGRQDHECWVVKLDKKKLLDSLVPVMTVHPNEEILP